MHGQPTGGPMSADVQMERRVRCSCGFQTGWLDLHDAIHIADHHDLAPALGDGLHCGGHVEYDEREKTGPNLSDHNLDPEYLKTVCPHCDDGKDHECQYCGKGFRRENSRDDHELTCVAP